MIETMLQWLTPFCYSLYNYPHMRRILVILLLSWLPVQSSWAALSVYCGHEAGAAVQAHAGHHEHAHDRAGPDASSGNSAENSADNSVLGKAGSGQPGGQTGSHPDCAVCHLAVSLTGDTAAAYATGTDIAPSVAAVSALPAPLPAKPERPKWLPA